MVLSVVAAEPGQILPGKCTHPRVSHSCRTSRQWSDLSHSGGSSWRGVRNRRTWSTLVCCQLKVLKRCSPPALTKPPPGPIGLPLNPPDPPLAPAGAEGPLAAPSKASAYSASTKAAALKFSVLADRILVTSSGNRDILLFLYPLFLLCFLFKIFLGFLGDPKRKCLTFQSVQFDSALNGLSDKHPAH